MNSFTPRDPSKLETLGGEKRTCAARSTTKTARRKPSEKWAIRRSLPPPTPRMRRDGLRPRHARRYGPAVKSRRRFITLFSRADPTGRGRGSMMAGGVDGAGGLVYYYSPSRIGSGGPGRAADARPSIVRGSGRNNAATAAKGTTITRPCR